MALDSLDAHELLLGDLGVGATDKGEVGSATLGRGERDGCEASEDPPIGPLDVAFHVDLDDT